MGAVTAKKSVASAKVLLVDDEPATLRQLTRFLTAAGFACEACADIDTAWDRATTGTCDVAFIDILLDERPLGYVLISRLRADPRTATLPIVAMTGYGEEHREKARKLGAHAAIDKLRFYDEAERLIAKLLAMRPAQGGLILYLEDDEGWAGLVRTSLGEAGMQVRRVSDRKALLEALAGPGPRPDAVLLDLSLDGDDGLRVLKELKTSPATQDVPVIVLTGRPDVKLACVKLGAVGFVEKNGAQEELVAVVSTTLRQHARSRGVVELDDVTLDPLGGLVFLDGKLVAKLEPRHFAILKALVLHSPDVVSDDVLLAAAARRHKDAREETTRSRSLATYISDLKQALGEPLKGRIRCEKLSGYRFAAKSELPPSSKI